MATVTPGKIFSSGEIVTPANLNALGVPAVALANNEVTTAKIADANVTTAKIADANVTTAKIADGSVSTAKVANSAVTFDKLNLPPGFPVQVVQAVKTDVQTIDTSSFDWIDVTDLNITLARAMPTALMKIRVQAVISNSSNNSNHGSAFRIMRSLVAGNAGFSAIGVGITEGLRIPTTSMGSYDGEHQASAAVIDFIDSYPSATPTVYYKIQARIVSTGLGYINRSNSDTNIGDYSYRPISTMTLTELAP
jgi:hypothetical protein